MADKAVRSATGASGSRRRERHGHGSLFDKEIRGFRKWRMLFGPILMLGGILGLFLPVLPGLLLLFLGFALVFPRAAENFMDAVRHVLRWGQST